MDQLSLPINMRAIVLEDYNSSLMGALRSLKTVELPVREPGNKEVVVKMQAAPCNPSDIAFIRGMYNITKEVPVVAGFEGTGEIIATGSSPEAMALKGKRVSCFTQDEGHGTWAEYFVTDHTNCIVLKDEIDMQQAACLAINPFTAIAIFNMAVERGSKAIIQNAAAGQIGIFIRAFAKNLSMPVINIVRKDEHIEQLQNEGEKFVLNQNSDGFGSDLSKLAAKLDASTAFDAVGGEMTGTLLNSLPEKGQVILYGGLSGDPVGNIDALGVIFKDKSLTGFNLGDWIGKIPKDLFEKISNELQERIIRGEIQTTIQQEFGFEKAVRGLLQYIGNMSKGKILFVP